MRGFCIYVFKNSIGFAILFTPRGKKDPCSFEDPSNLTRLTRMSSLPASGSPSLRNTKVLFFS
jgi:hypothetical protein